MTHTEEPLIHTIRGNLPVASLKFSVNWRFENGIVFFTQTYTAEDGVVVRQDAHIFDTVGIQARALASE